MRYLKLPNFDLSSMLDSILIFLGIIIPAILTYRLGLNKHKIELQKLQAQNKELTNQKTETEIKMTYFNQIIDVTSINIISGAVDRMFEKTKADQFLIMIAVNGKTDFNMISVVFEQHKTKAFRINAIARYHNITIDTQYKQLLKDTEKNEVILLETDSMQESMLKDFYMDEKITHAIIRKLIRKPIDNTNDFLVYSSIATHENQEFSRTERAFIKTQYEGTIIPNIEKVLSNGG